jgi:hypothetical protein
MTLKKVWWVDFGTQSVEAETEEEARALAEKLVEGSDIIIDTVQDTGETVETPDVEPEKSELRTFRATRLYSSTPDWGRLLEELQDLLRSYGGKDWEFDWEVD